MRGVAMVATVTVFASARAHADDALLASQLRIARDAATHGHCDVAAQIATQVAQADTTFYTDRFLADAAIATCVKHPEASSQPQPTREAVHPNVAEPPPPLHTSRVAGELGAGAALGVSTAFVAAVIAVNFPGQDTGAGGHADTLGYEFWATAGSIAFGVPIGAAVGVYLVGNVGNQTGSGLAALGGAVAGEALGIAVGLAVPTHEFGLHVIVPAVASTVLIPIGATIGFNLTRRYDHVTIAPIATSNSIGLAGTF